MFKGLTEYAQIILTRSAQDHARRLRSSQLLPEHLLLAILSLRKGNAYQILSNLHIPLLELQAKLDSLVPLEPRGAVLGDVPPSRSTQRVLEDSAEAARTLGSDFIDSGHLLAAVCRTAEGALKDVLTLGGITSDLVIDALSQAKPENEPSSQIIPREIRERVARTTTDEIMNYLSRIKKPLGKMTSEELANVKEFIAAIILKIANLNG